MKTKTLFIILILTVTAYSQPKNYINMLTEHYPPYNMKIDGKLTGMSVEILNEMLKQMQSKQSIGDVKLSNWSRAYTITLKKKNTMLFSTTRTKERELLFKWVGPIKNVDIGLIAPKRKNIKINNISDLNKYIIGTVSKDVGEQLLIKSGVRKKNMQYVSGENAINLSFKKMKRNRIDMFSYNTTVAFENAKDNGLDSNLYEIVYVLEKNALYFAFNLKTDDEVIEKWQKALDQIKQNGTYSKILKKY